ncbi:calycin-like domain-containing protein [Alloprevotella tannerae]|uniref:calycin-like domain-containing protein n=1 Tax=Alloprevotella tannerae TaxID=76122 RepID=UPI0028F0A115|nr:calycin-like domain-containing protein [Alloprevotella tannerae]
MRHFLLTSFFAALALSLSAQTGAFQVNNSGFETWKDVNEPGDGWYSFVSANTSGLGLLGSVAKNSSKKNTVKIEGRTGSAVLLKSSSIWGAKANGNLTTGCINMGSSTPANKANYNYTNRSGVNSCLFAGRPDSLVFYAKFKRGQGGNDTYTGRCHAVLHGDIDYKDPHETEENKAKYLIAETTIYSTVTDEWTRYAGAFTYTGTTAEKMYMLASFTTNETPGASYNDEFSIDDVQFIYNSQLKSIAYKGAAVPVSAQVDLSAETYEPAALVLAADGAGAIIDTTYNAETCVLTVTVKGNDFSVSPDNVHSYEIQFAKASEPALASVKISGEPFAAFTPDVKEYTLPYAYAPGIVIEGTPAEGFKMVNDSLETTFGKFAEPAFYDNAQKCITLKVTDGSKTTDYTFKFTDAVADTKSGDYPGSLSVSLTAANDIAVPIPLNNAAVLVTKNSNGTYNLDLKQFSFAGIPVGDIHVADIPLQNDTLAAQRTIRLTAYQADGTIDNSSMGWSLGHLPVKVALHLLDADQHQVEGGIDILTEANPTLSTMFKRIHVDFVSLVLAPTQADTTNNQRKCYANLKVTKGLLTKYAARFLALNNTWSDAAGVYNLPMSYLDLTGVAISADVTVEDLRQGQPSVNNTLYYLPATTTLRGDNFIVGGRTARFALQDAAPLFIPQDFTAESVTYDRVFDTGANTLSTSFILPFDFDVPTSNMKVAGFATVTNTAGNDYLLNFNETAHATAHTPYLLQTFDIHPFDRLTNVDVKATPQKTYSLKLDPFTHTGVYADSTLDAAAEVYVYDDLKFTKMTTNVVSPFRTFFTSTKPIGELKLDVNGVLTGVCGPVRSDRDGKAASRYDLNGRHTNGSAKGLQIVDGKKIYRK